MIAPPAAQAHNLANAIRTDIGSTLVCLRGPVILPTGRFPIANNAKQSVNFNAVNS
jgi:hypothetical protein